MSTVHRLYFYPFLPCRTIRHLFCIKCPTLHSSVWQSLHLFAIIIVAIIIVVIIPFSRHTTFSDFIFLFLYTFLFSHIHIYRRFERGSLHLQHNSSTVIFLSSTSLSYRSFRSFSFSFSFPFLKLSTLQYTYIYIYIFFGINASLRGVGIKLFSVNKLMHVDSRVHIWIVKRKETELVQVCGCVLSCESHTRHFDGKVTCHCQYIVTIIMAMIIIIVKRKVEGQYL